MSIIRYGMAVYRTWPDVEPVAWCTSEDAAIAAERLLSGRCSAQPKLYDPKSVIVSVNGVKFDPV